MRLETNDDGTADSLVLVFDERDAGLDEAARALLQSAHAAGVLSVNALRTLRKDNQDVPSELGGMALVVFSQALGASLGLTLKHSVSKALTMIYLTAGIAGMSEDDRAAANAKLRELADLLTNEETKH